MNEADIEQNLKDLEELERRLDLIKDRLFNNRDPQSLQFALDTFVMRHKKKPVLMDYWQLLIGGLKKNIERMGK
jgi:hypothetical protein